jgi:NADPH:quinone reductase-like Zn-dependent oxidoreductase
LELGADYVVNHRKDDWHKEVRSIAKKIPKSLGDVPGVDVIFEHIGGTHWNKELTLLNYGGTIVTTGATTGYDAKTDLRQIFFKGINILGSSQSLHHNL